MTETSEKTADLRECLRCRLHALAEEDAKNISFYVQAIRPEDRAAEELVEKRLSVCFACEKRQTITCTACGCYIEFRASVRDGRCPRNRWTE